jgi:uncharacterized iron-regulated membrane protein
MSRRTRIIVRWLHKWLGLLLGVQVLAWLTSGLVMTAIPIEQVRGTAWVRQPEAGMEGRAAEFRLSPAEVAFPEGFGSAVAAIRLGEPVYLLREGTRTVGVVHAGDGHLVQRLNEAEAAALASTLHSEHPAVREARLVEQPDGEARGMSGPVWRVALVDRWNTHVYIDPLSARLLAVRNDIWRFYDFFWMLHIMDFEAREDINNNLLRGSTALSWFIGLSGIWLLFYSFGRRPAARAQADQQGR